MGVKSFVALGPEVSLGTVGPPCVGSERTLLTFSTFLIISRCRQGLYSNPRPGNPKGGSINVLLISYLTGLD
jgi:hypothetical protein